MGHPATGPPLTWRLRTGQPGAERTARRWTLGAGDARVHPKTLIGHAYAPPPTIVVTVHMWITWSELAIQHEQEALSARQAMLDLYAKGGNFALELGRETGDSLIAICSTAFAMDALVGVWARLVMDQQTVARWEGQPARAQIGGRSRCPWITTSDRSFPSVLARIRHATLMQTTGY